jgi:2-phosphoglycerate kinase
VTSTDFVRQTMRAFFSQDFMPAIHYSSFEAGASQDDDDEDRVLHGFLAQTRNVLVGVRAAIERVMQEGWSMVLEGVHLVPGMVSAEIEGALVIQFVLAIEDVEAHASHFWLRDSISGSARPFERYLDALGDIRELQDYIVSRAEKAGVPVIENSNIELAIAQAMELVLESAERFEKVG